MFCYIGSSYSSAMLNNSVQTLSDSTTDNEVLTISDSVCIAYDRRHYSMIKCNGGFVLCRGMYCPSISALFSGDMRTVIEGASGECTVITYNDTNGVLCVYDSANSLYMGNCFVTFDSSGERIRKEYVISTSVAAIKSLCNSESIVSKLINSYYLRLDVNEAMKPHPVPYTGCETFEPVR